MHIPLVPVVFPYAGHSCLVAHHHCWFSSFKPAYTVSFPKLAHMNIPEHFAQNSKVLILRDQHYITTRIYVGRLKMRLCELLELLQITGILNIFFIGVSRVMFLKNILNPDPCDFTTVGLVFVALYSMCEYIAV